MIKRTTLKDMKAAIAATTALVPPETNAINARKFAASDSSPSTESILFHTGVGCGFMQHVKNEAKDLSEPEWYGAISVVAVCENASELAHDISRNYDGYSEAETEAKLERAKKSKYGPTTCQHIRDNFGEACAGCPHNIKSPAVLASQPKYSRLAEAHDRVLEVLAAVEGGETSAHLTALALKDFALLKKMLLPKYNEFREILKKCKATLPDFDKGVLQELKGSQETSFPGPQEPIYKKIMDKLTGSNYHISEDGELCTLDKDGNPVKISNFVIVPLKEIVRDDGANAEIRFEVRAICAGGEKLPSVVVTQAELANLNFALQNWGLKCRILPGFTNTALLRDSIFELAKKIKRETIYTHTGWRKIEGNWVFLHSKGAVGSANVRVELSDTTKQCALPEPPSDADAIKAIRASLNLRRVAPLAVTLPLLAAAFLSVLCEAARMAGIEPEFVVWLCGRTGSRKTTLALLVLQHFGNFTRPPASFKDTANALGQKAFLAKDIPLLVDDFHPVGTPKEAQNMVNLAAYVLRLYGDRIGKGRLNAQIELQESRPPRGIAIVTAEDGPPGGESDVARTVTVAIGTDDVNLEKLTAAQENQAQLAYCMAAFIDWLAPKMDELPALLAEQFRELREHFQKQSVHGRTGESAAWLSIAWETFVDFAAEKSAIDAEKAAQLKMLGRKTFAALVREQTQRLQCQQPAAVFLQVLAEMLSSGRATTQPANPNVRTLGPRESTHIGFDDQQYFYLFPETAYNRVTQFLQSRNQRLGISPKALWERLADDAHIETEIENQGTSRERRMFAKKKKIDSSSDRPRLLWLKRSSIEEEEASNDDK